MYRIVLLCVVLCACAASRSKQTYSLKDAEVLFEKFIIDHDKHYGDQHEKRMRFDIFKKTLVEINKLNKGQKGAPVFGINLFSDYTEEETKHLYGFTPTLKGNLCSIIKDDIDIPDYNAPAAFDWRQRNIVSQAKNQKTCGSCYAFSSTGNIEAQYAKKNGQMISLSEQQIVDCYKGKRHDDGCKMGNPSGTFMNMLEGGGIQSESDYPYIDADGTCAFDPSKVVVKLQDCTSYNLQSQEKLKQLLYHTGPISVGLNATTLNKYHGGILDNCSSGYNHYVLLIGYGTDPNHGDYWVIKNSWGADWGEEGTFRIERGEGKISCGILNIGMSTVTIA